MALRRKIYSSLDELQADLDAWVAGYSRNRPHQGRWCFGNPELRRKARKRLVSVTAA